MKINILGKEWDVRKIKDGEDDRMSGNLGFADKSTREIGVLDPTERTAGEIKDRGKMLRHTLRHEVIHALIAECGIDQYIDWAGSEEVVDFFAYHYPNFKEIFNLLEIED